MINLSEWCTNNLELKYSNPELSKIYFKYDCPIPESVYKFNTRWPWTMFRDLFIRYFKLYNIESYLDSNTVLTISDSLHKHNFWEKLYYHAGLNLLNFLFKNAKIYYTLDGKTFITLLDWDQILKKKITPKKISFNYKSALVCQGLGYDGGLSIGRHKMLYRAGYCKNSLHVIPNKTVESVIDDIWKQPVGQELPPYRTKHEFYKYRKYLKKLLDKNPTFGQCRRVLNNYLDCNELVSSKRKIIIFIQTIIRTYIPYKLFDRKKNLNKFINNLEVILSYNMKQRVTLAHIMADLKEIKFLWKKHFLAKMMLWIIDVFVLKIIRMFFYVSETSLGNDLVFIKSPFWMEYQEEIIEQMILVGQLELCKSPIPSDEIRRMRFLPKESGSGYRPLVRNSIFDKKMKDRYDICLVFLKQLIATKRGEFPMVITDLHRAWSNFTNSRRTYKYDKCYFVKTDIMDAYGSVNHDKLKNILEGYINEIEVDNCFVLASFSYEGIWGEEKILKQFKNLKLCAGSKVLSYEQGKDTTITVCELKKHIYSYIDNFFVKVRGNKKRFRMRKGLPQGGRLSGMLCEIYYSALDREHLSCLHQPAHGDIMLRAVDDYIFISSDKARTSQFLSKMLGGFSDYGVIIQREKTFSNISYITEPAPYILLNSSKVLFYGFHLDIERNQITANIDNYNDINFKSRMTFKKLNKKLLEERMSSTRTLKLHQLLLDPKYLTKMTIFTNIYYASCVMAARFNTIVSFLIRLRIVLDEDYLFGCIRQGVSSITFISSKRGTPKVKNNSAKKICIKAFIRVLEKIHSFSDIVRQLRLYSSRLKIIPKRDEKLIKIISKDLPSPLLRGMGLT